jgi:uncharacterized protein with HEPN domain
MLLHMSKIDPYILSLLEDIYTSAERIADRLQNETLECFTSQASTDMQDMVARRMTIMGEAASRLLKKYPEFSEQHPDIALHQARRMRNALVHDYNRVDWNLVWKTIHTELPQLMDAIGPFLSKKR